MNNYIATFYSHYGAMQYYKSLKNQGITAKLKPAPRKVSVSCGTCVSYEHDTAIDLSDCELDSIYIENNSKYTQVMQK